MKCPICAGPVHYDEVDNGLGMQQVGPAGCDVCQWVEGDTAADTAERIIEIERHAAEAERERMLQAEVLAEIDDDAQDAPLESEAEQIAQPGYATGSPR